MKLGLDRLPWYGQIGVFLLVAALGLLAFHAAWGVPARRAAALREQTLDGRRNEIAAARRAERRRPALAAQVAALEARLGRVRTVPAAAHDSGALLRRLQALAQASDLALRAFTPQAPVAHALHEERPSRIELTGTFMVWRASWIGSAGCRAPSASATSTCAPAIGPGRPERSTRPAPSRRSRRSS